MGVRLVDQEFHASLGSCFRALRKHCLGQGSCIRDGLQVWLGGRSHTGGSEQSSSGRGLRI